MRKFIAYFDGCCEPVNPGGTMGFGAIVTENGQAIWYSAGRSGPENGTTTSSNLAEYAALLAVLDYFIEQKMTDAHIEIRGDSKLVIEQMAGRWRIGQGIYVQAAYKARELAKGFAKLRFTWIPRAENHLADELSRSELIEAGIQIPDRRRSA
jgi:ribonuclease H / adenosylcobalamin/alpha-ribazole phosphatase